MANRPPSYCRLAAIALAEHRARQEAEAAIQKAIGALLAGQSLLDQPPELRAAQQALWDKWLSIAQNKDDACNALAKQQTPSERATADSKLYHAAERFVDAFHANDDLAYSVARNELRVAAHWSNHV